MRKKNLRLFAIPLMACTMMFFAPSTVTAADINPSANTSGGTTPDGNTPGGSGDTSGGDTGTAAPSVGAGGAGGTNTSARQDDNNTDVSQGTVTITEFTCPDDSCIGHTITGNGTGTIKVTKGTHDIILQNVTVDGASADVPAFEICTGATVNLYLEGTNTLTSAIGKAGILVPSGANLNIYSDTDPVGTLTVTGGNGAAGIGAQGYGLPSGNITIHNGNINATGGEQCAGIGGAARGSAGTITITGGNVVATGGDGKKGVITGGSGIGCGGGGNGGEIIISGGTVTAIGGRNNPPADKPKNSGITCKNLSSGDGSATIIASSVKYDNASKLNGIIWDEDEKIGFVYGDAVLNESLFDQTLNIPPNSSLTIPPDAGLMNGPGSQILGSGSIINADKLDNGGGTTSESLILKVSLSEDDVHTVDQVFTGADLTKEAIQISETRANPFGDDYIVDSPDSWNRTIEIWGGGTADIIRDAHTYIITYSKDGYPDIVKEVTVTAKPLEKEMVSTIDSQSYTGEEIKPEVVIKYNGMILDKTIDYTVVYENNKAISTADKPAVAKIKARNNGNYSGEIDQPFTINPASIANAEVTVEPASAKYDGTKKTPTVTVKLGDKVLIQGVDYTIANSGDLVSAGTVTYTIEGTGNYTDAAPLTTFEIEKLPVTVNVNNLSAVNRPYDGTNEVELSNVQFVGVLPAGTYWKLQCQLEI